MNAGETGESGATQDMREYRFGLIVGGVRDCDAG